MNSVVRRLVNFCLRLGGKVEDMPLPSEFSCDVDPNAIIRRFSEFKKLTEELRRSGEITRAYFGRDDAYFFIYPREVVAGFGLHYHF